MNKTAFLQLIQQVSGITDQQTDELEKVASAFPYCQTAHLLLAKSAYDKGSMLSSQRLRRASSYATNRQLLKKIIYAVPAPPVPVYEDAETLEAPAHTPEELHQPEVSQAAAVETAAVENSSPSTDPASENIPENTPLEDETAAETTPAAEADTEVTGNAPEESLYSELAMLLNINSLSSSSTDLFIARPDNTSVEPSTLPLEVQEQPEVHIDATWEETLEAAALPQSEAETSASTVSDGEISEDATGTAADSSEQEPAATIEHLPAPEEKASEQVEAVAAAETPYGAINYNADEIERLYAEDALGYWMGSSRLGEVLQLKDEVTRPKPQSFHPELILEYSKTHELEKSIQPARNVLSQQLNIIDQFLKLNPRLKTKANLKLKEEPQEDLSLKSSRIKKGLVSENLATIFLKQGKVKKAVKIYEQLILKYPEKKTYFAEQIEKLQNPN